MEEVQGLRSCRAVAVLGQTGGAEAANSAETPRFMTSDSSKRARMRASGLRLGWRVRRKSHAEHSVRLVSADCDEMPSRTLP